MKTSKEILEIGANGIARARKMVWPIATERTTIDLKLEDLFSAKYQVFRLIDDYKIKQQFNNESSALYGRDLDDKHVETVAKIISGEIPLSQNILTSAQDLKPEDLSGGLAIFIPSDAQVTQTVDAFFYASSEIIAMAGSSAGRVNRALWDKFEDNQYGTKIALFDSKGIRLK